MSRRRGQRFESLEAIRKAVQVGQELELPSARTDELRNIAIAALTLSDVKTLRRWNGYLEGDFIMAAGDARMERYARANRSGKISVRNVADDSEIVELTGFPGYGFLLFSPDGRFIANLDRQSR